MDNYNFPSDDYSYNNMGLGNALKEGKANQASYQNENKLIGFFARVNYNYKGRYFVSASMKVLPNSVKITNGVTSRQYPWRGI